MKKKVIIGVSILLCVLLVMVCFLAKNYSTGKETISTNYIAVFHGGVGEITYETYIYKINNGHANSGFKYVNVTSTTKSWGSSEWDSRITKKGKCQWTDDVFKIAKENNAYSYVTVPDNNKIYSIEEFEKVFLMD